MASNVAVAILCLAIAGMSAQWIAWRLRLPAIVLLFATGLALGPGLEILEPAKDFGAAMQPLVGLAVALVVFEGGLALNIRELRAAGQGVLRLTVHAVPIGFGLATLAARFVGGLGWGAAILFGAITIVTGPTVILPLLRQSPLQPRAGSFLKWEAIVNDPVGALAASIVLAVLGAHGRWEIAGLPGGVVVGVTAAVGLAVAVGLGVGAGFLVRFLFINDLAPERLKIPIMLALVLGVYAVSNVVIDDIGLAAATIFGLTLANLKIPGMRELTRFKEALVVTLVSALFVLFSANLDRSVLGAVSWPLLALTAVMMLVVRPAAIWLASIRGGMGWHERAFVGWIAPRGVMAAAVAGVAGTNLAQVGYAGADKVMPAVFALIAATMVLHGFSFRPLARRLGLTLGDRAVLAIVGASPWSTDLAACLAAEGNGVLLIDIYPAALDEARARGLPVLQVEVLSEHGAENLSGHRVDYLFAATPDNAYNSLVATQLAPDLGRHRVFQLSPSGGAPDHWVDPSREWRGEVAGRPALTFAEYGERYLEGWRFAVREASESEGDPLRTAEGVTLAFLRPNGDLRFASGEAGEVSAGTGDKLLVFGPREAATPAAGAEAPVVARA